MAADRRPPPPLLDGEIVTIFGLSTRTDLNGAQGKLSHRQADTGRWQVRLNGSDEVISVREAKLVHPVDYDTDEDHPAQRVAERERAARAAQLP